MGSAIGNAKVFDVSSKVNNNLTGNAGFVVHSEKLTWHSLHNDYNCWDLWMTLPVDRSKLLLINYQTCNDKNVKHNSYDMKTTS